MRLNIISLIPTRNSSFQWFAFEVAEAASIAEVYRLLSENKCLLGERLKLDRADAEPGARKIVSREPYIVGLGMVGTIGELPFDIVE